MRSCIQGITVLGFFLIGFAVETDARTVELEKRLASDGAAEDQFGAPIAADGDVALVGTHQDDDAGSKSGAAYVLERANDGSWSEAQKLVASDAAAQDWFGWAVAVSGDWALVGAIGDDDNGSGSGSVYAFERQGDGSWLEQQKLSASDGAANDAFGWSLAIDGGLAAVGAPYDDDAGTRSGSVYVFEQQGDGSWLEIQKLGAGDGAANDLFGGALAMSGGWALIGAGGDDDKGLTSGSVYFFEEQGDGSWLEQQKLSASDGQADDDFGLALSLDGGLAIVGAAGVGDLGADAGAAYVIEQQGDGSWLEIQKLTSSDGAAGDAFGASVSLSGGRALVGADGDDVSAMNNGSAYVFEEQGDGSWLETEKVIASDGLARDAFGAAVALIGHVLVIGATGTDDAGDTSGSVYVFDLRITPYDEGCAGTTATAPVLSGSGNPSIGGALTVSIDDGPPSAPILLFVGLFQVDVPLGFDCSLLVSPIALQLPLALNGAGSLSFTGSIPGDAAPGTIVLQVLVGDLLVPGGFAATNGLQVELTP